jgi:hypothetical protein
MTWQPLCSFEFDTPYLVAPLQPKMFLIYKMLRCENSAPPDLQSGGNQG